MRDEAAFLRTIAAAPADDAPRLVYADWLDDRGDPRGTFVRVQCALATLPADDLRRHDLEEIAHRLLAAHAAEWTRDIAGRVSGWNFRRGFVEEITLSATAFLEHGGDLFRSGLIQTVRLHDVGELAPALARFQALGQVAHLDLCGNRLGDDGIAILARSELVRGLRELDLSFNSLSNGGLQALLDAGPWPRLSLLALQGNDRVTGRGATAMAHSRSLPVLRTLDLRDNDIDAPGVWALANNKTLTELSELGLAGNPLGDAGARVLAQSSLLPRQLARTGTLDLRHTAVGPAGVQALVVGEHLRAAVGLWLDGNHIGDPGLVALSIADLPALRELHLAGNGITDEGLAALAGAPVLNRLTIVDLADNSFSPGGVVTLMGSPYRHWRTQFDLSGNRPPEPGNRRDERPIPIIGGEDRSAL
jgi:uncharacterized protein (TIGR02996 family)